MASPGRLQDPHERAAKHESQPLIPRILRKNASTVEGHRWLVAAATSLTFFMLLVTFFLSKIGPAISLASLSATTTSTSILTTTHQKIRKDAIVPIEDAREYLLTVDDVHNTAIQVWFRTWGNPNGAPVLFVHGGPGQAVVDYANGNRRFFDASQFFVVEVDQRGTGSSQPSVRDDWHNMQLYSNISNAVFSHDYEVVRTYLGIDQWMVWGGSYGSTVGLDYAMRYPNSVTALILRGVYLDTEAEMDEVYTQNAFLNNPKQQSDFLQLYGFAAQRTAAMGRVPLDPNDAFELTSLYHEMITRGDRQAIWQWVAFENNLMEEDPNLLLDPNAIQESKFPEAQSIGFFETRLWVHETWEAPSRLLRRVSSLDKIPIWICQGKRDYVCPPQNALHLVQALQARERDRNSDRSAPLRARFVDSGHEDTDPVMEACLQTTTKEFLESTKKSKRLR